MISVVLAGLALGKHKIAGGVAQRASVEVGEGRTQFLECRGLRRAGQSPLARSALWRLGHGNGAPGGLALRWLQAVDGVEFDCLVGTPF